MVWRADCPTRDLVYSPLISVHSWYHLPNPGGFFYRVRWIKYTVWIRKTVPTMNRDEGATD